MRQENKDEESPLSNALIFVLLILLLGITVKVCRPPATDIEPERTLYTDDTCVVVITKQSTQDEIIDEVDWCITQLK